MLAEGKCPDETTGKVRLANVLASPPFPLVVDEGYMGKIITLLPNSVYFHMMATVVAKDRENSSARQWSSLRSEGKAAVV
jgi:hypothetical protein